MRTAELPLSVFSLTSPYMTPPNTAIWTDKKQQKCILIWTSQEAVERWLRSQVGTYRYEEYATNVFIVWAMAVLESRFLFVDATPEDNVRDAEVFEDLPADRLIDLEDSSSAQSAIDALLGHAGAPLAFLEGVRYWAAKHPELKPMDLFKSVADNAHQILAEIEQKKSAG